MRMAQQSSCPEHPVSTASLTLRQEDTPRPLNGTTRQPHCPAPSASLEYDGVDIARCS